MTRSTTAHLVGSNPALVLMLALLLAPAPALAQFFVPAPQVWTQAQMPAYLADGIEAWDSFGSALERGDFNGDGFDDLAIGSPGEGVFSYAEHGLVHVLYGSAAGLTAASAQAVYPTQDGYLNLLESAHFGRALASGDFDGDGFDDLAVGMPVLTVDSDYGAGGVQLIYGSSAGLNLARTLRLTPSSGSVDVPTHTGAYFGSALEAMDLNGDGFDELAIGQPSLRVSNQSRSGAVHILSGSVSGLTLEVRTIDQSVLHNGVPGLNDLFGSVLASGNVNGDGREDLVIAAPGKKVNSAFNAGVVFVLRGTANGPDHLTYTRLVQEGTSGANSPESYDSFGASLALGDINRDGKDDLAVGVPGQSRNTGKTLVSGSGAVNLFYGVAAGVSTTSAAYLDQAAAGVGGLEANDCFGAAVALGDTSGDGYAELYVGVPHENNAGAYQRFLTGLSGVALSGSVLVLQPGQGASEPHDRFGREMVLGDFDGNGLPDLAVSAPGESFGTLAGAGQVHVKYHDYPQVILP